jgi:hypothetical protein
MKKFIYSNSNLSGIGDRLLDLMLVLTYANYLGYDEIYLHWKVDNNDMIGDKSYYSKLRREKTSFRGVDYLLNNLQNYLTLPSTINFVENDELEKLKNDKNNYNFNEYLGLRYNLYSFMNHYKIENKKKFEKLYFENFNKIQFKNIPDEIINYFKNNDVVTVHLRRGDKVAINDDANYGIKISNLDNLNNLTLKKIKLLQKKGFKYFNFVSDEKNTRNYFINILKSELECKYFDGDEISQTYFDLYSIAHSKKILLSQVYSSFSIFASMINKVELNYFNENSKINDFSKHKHINKI